MRLTLNIVVILLIAIMVAGIAAYADTEPTWQFTTINKIKMNKYGESDHGWWRGNYEWQLSDGLYIREHSHDSTGGTMVLGIIYSEIPDIPGTSADEKVKVTSNDTVNDYLLEKITAGAGISIAEVGDGGDEDLEITCTLGGSDELVKVSGDETAAGYLEDQITAGTNITLTVGAEGSDESISIASADNKVQVSTNDTTPDELDAKIVAGTGISLAELNDGADEDLEITCTVTDTNTDTLVSVSTNDSTPDELDAKITAGTGISLSEINDGGDEDLQITCTVTDTNTDTLVKVSANDTTADELDAKIVAGTGITLNELNDAGDEDLEIVCTVTDTNTDTLVKVSANDTTADELDAKIVAGTGITLNELGDGGDEDLEIVCTVTDTNTDTLVKVSANDTTADELDAKLVAGTGITLSEVGDGGDEDLQITCTVTDTDTDAKVGVDSGATPDYLGASSSTGALRTDHGIDYADNGDSIMLETDLTHFVWYGDVSASQTDLMLGDEPWADGVISSFDGQPDYPRNLIVSVVSLMNNCTGTVTVYGTDADGESISEAFSISITSPPDTQIEYGDKAFALVTSVDIDTSDGVGATISLGVSDKLGLTNYPWDSANDIFKAVRNGRNMTVTGVDRTYGTFDVATAEYAIINGDDFGFWYRPNK